MVLPSLPSIYWYIPGVILFVSPSWDKGFVPEKKKAGKKKIERNRLPFPKICCAILISNFSVEKEKGACCTPCGPQMFQLLPLCAEIFFFYSIVPTHNVKRVFLLRHLAKVKNTVDKVKKATRKKTVHRICTDKEEGMRGSFSRVSPLKVRGGQYHALHRKMHGKRGVNYCCWLFWIYHTVRLS